MGLLSRFRRKRPEPPQPAGRLVVVSEGLRAHGQREIAFVIELEQGDSEAELRGQLDQLIDLIRGFAKRGQLVHPGGHTELVRPAS